MKKFLAGTLLLVSSVASAGYNIDQKSITTLNNTDLKTQWDNLATTAVTTHYDLASFDTGNNQFNRLMFEFDLDAQFTGDWMFDAGLDGHWGGALYIDDVLVSENFDDLWWGGSNWNHSDVISEIADFSTSGLHKFELYWGEMVNSGNQSIRFKVAGQNNWEVLSEQNIEKYTAAVGPSQIPEPSVLALFALGLLGLGRRVLKK